MRESWLPPPFTRVCLNFIHFDIQSRNQDICLPSKRFIVTPVVCPRLFEIITTLTSRALRRNHIVPSASVATKKKRTRQRQRKPIVYVRSAMYHESPNAQPKLGRECCVEKKTRSHVTSVIAHKLPRRGFISITGLINSKNMKSAKKSVWSQFLHIRENLHNDKSVIIFAEMVRDNGGSRSRTPSWATVANVTSDWSLLALRHTMCVVFEAQMPHFDLPSPRFRVCSSAPTSAPRRVPARRNQLSHTERPSSFPTKCWPRQISHVQRGSLHSLLN